MLHLGVWCLHRSGPKLATPIGKPMEIVSALESSLGNQSPPSLALGIHVPVHSNLLIEWRDHDDSVRRVISQRSHLFGIAEYHNRTAATPKMRILTALTPKQGQVHFLHANCNRGKGNANNVLWPRAYRLPHLSSHTSSSTCEGEAGVGQHADQVSRRRSLGPHLSALVRNLQDVSLSLAEDRPRHTALTGTILI